MSVSPAGDEVPTVALDGLLSSEAPDRKKLAREVDEICETIGFFRISGHGIDDELIRSTEETFRQFFGLPLERKLAVRSDGGEPGYKPLGSASAARSLDKKAPPDLNEKFIVAPPRSGNHPSSQSVAARTWFPSNRWPTQPADLRQIVSRYYEAMLRLSHNIMRLLALGLGFEEAHFDDKIDRPITRLNAINYPAHTPPSPHQRLAGEHTDFGGLTILHKEEGAVGLEIRNSHGKWVPVKPVAGTFIVNIGDLLARWTNDRWRSTLHRVVSPEGDRGRADGQISLAFFHSPNFDVTIQPLDTCIAEDRPPLYPPVTSGEHILEKLRKAIEHGNPYASR